MHMRLFALSALTCLVLGSIALAAGVDLKIKDIEIDPEPVGTTSPKIQLGIHRSYRIIVTIKKSTALPQGASFVVRTQCNRNGKSVTIGEARVGDSKGWNIYACYDLYPGQAGSGDCLLRTTIDANNEIGEPDESATSNVWDRKATLVGP